MDAPKIIPEEELIAGRAYRLANGSDALYLPTDNDISWNVGRQMENGTWWKDWIDHAHARPVSKLGPVMSESELEKRIEAVLDDLGYVSSQPHYIRAREVLRKHFPSSSLPEHEDWKKKYEELNTRLGQLRETTQSFQALKARAEAAESKVKSLEAEIEAAKRGDAQRYLAERNALAWECEHWRAFAYNLVMGKAVTPNG